MTDNKHKVPKRQWLKWGLNSQEVFNGLYEYMDENQHLFIHPHTILIPKEYWNTTAWNAAFMAAELVKQNDKETIFDKIKEDAE